MSIFVPNALYISGSKYLKKEDRVKSLVYGSLFNGWLIPINDKKTEEKYRPAYILEEVYDPIIGESKEIQKQNRAYFICQGNEEQLRIEISSYVKSTGKTFKELNESSDPFYRSKCEEAREAVDDLSRCFKKLNHLRTSLLNPVDENEKPFKFLNHKQFMALPDKEWLVSDLLGKNDIGVVYGPSGKGKTFVLVDFVLQMCTGKILAHTFKPKRPLSVCYCVGEGASGLKERFQASQIHHGVDTLENFYFSDSVPQLFELDSACSAQNFISQWKSEEISAIDVIIIDTFRRATIGSDENSSKEMGVALDVAQTIAKSLDCAVILIHHTNKMEESESGSGNIRASADFMIKVSHDIGKNTPKLTCDKLKEGKQWSGLPFSIVSVQGTNSACVVWGEQISSDGIDVELSDDDKTNKIFELLKGIYPQSIKRKAIDEALGFGRDKTNLLLRNLVDNKKCLRQLENPSLKLSKLNPWVYKIHDNQA